MKSGKFNSYSAGLIVAFSCLFFSELSFATTYYVSSSASDSNDGKSTGTPFKTLEKAVSKVAAGDKILLRSGDTFYPTKPARITYDSVEISTYGGSGYAVLDGNMRVPSSIYDGLIISLGDNFKVSNIEIRESAGSGINISGNNSVVSGNKINKVHTNGIGLFTNSGSVISGNVVTGANSGYPSGSLMPWGAGINIRECSNFKVVGNTVYEGWGEAIMPWHGAKNGTIAKNTIFAHHAAGIYVNGARYLDIYDNLITGTSLSKFHRSGGFTGPGIAFNNETSFWTSGSLDSADITSDINVYNNKVAGTSIGFGFWGQYSQTYYKNIKIVHNTFVDNEVQFGSAGYSRHYNTLIANNTFLSISSGRKDIGSPLDDSQVTYMSNAWTSSVASKGMSGSNDVYGGARLQKMSGWNNITSLGGVDSTDFLPSSGSSTQGGASYLSVTSFFNGSIPRGDDIGVYSGGQVATTDATPLPPHSLNIQ